MINSDTISTASRVLDCCNGYYGYMKPVYSWLLVATTLVHLAINYVVRGGGDGHWCNYWYY